MNSNDPALSPETDWEGPLTGLRIFGGLALLGAGLLAAHETYNAMMRAEVESKVLARPSVELAQLRAEEAAKLGNYRWVAKKDGVVQIPLARARELTLADYHAATPPRNPARSP